MTLFKELFLHNLQLKTTRMQSLTAKKYNRTMVWQMSTPTWRHWQMPVACAWETVIVSQAADVKAVLLHHDGLVRATFCDHFSFETLCSQKLRQQCTTVFGDNFMSRRFQHSESVRLNLLMRILTTKCASQLHLAAMPVTSASSTSLNLKIWLQHIFF